MRRVKIVIAVLALALVATVATSFAASSGTSVKAAKSRFGKIVVDGRGRTLYLFKKDTKGHSACNGACASYWPPLLTSAKPVAAAGAKQSLLGTIRRSDGKKQVTYGGHPLYRFVQDAKPGQIKGQDTHFFGGGWYVVSPAGKQVGD